MNSEIRKITSMQKDELFEEAKQLQVPYDLVLYVHDNGKLPVVNFAAGGVATPADAALMMQLGAEGVFVGSGIFKSGNPANVLLLSFRLLLTIRMQHLLPSYQKTLAKLW